MTAAERRLRERLASFFVDRAPHVSRQISAHLGHDDTRKVGAQAYGATVAGPPDGDERVVGADRDVQLLASKGSDHRDVQLFAAKSSDHPDLHVKPENAEGIQLYEPVPDVVTLANVQHVSWELVREGKNKTERRMVPIEALIPLQYVVDKKRVAKHEKVLAETGELEKEGAILVLEWDGDLFMLGGHHGTQAAKNLGWTEVPADVMVAD